MTLSCKGAEFFPRKVPLLMGQGYSDLLKDAAEKANDLR